jgi:hypothetical protein
VCGSVQLAGATVKGLSGSAQASQLVTTNITQTGDFGIFPMVQDVNEDSKP